jgi:hypothetical protein
MGQLSTLVLTIDEKGLAFERAIVHTLFERTCDVLHGLSVPILTSDNHKGIFVNEQVSSAKWTRAAQQKIISDGGA